MKKTKFIFSLLISLVMLIVMSNFSHAVTVSTSETPSSVSSGEEFYIVLKFDEPVNAMNSYIEYDSSLVTLSEETDIAYFTINPVYDNGVASVLYSTLSKTQTVETFKIKVKAAQVTEEKTANFKIQTLKAINENTGDAGNVMENIQFSVTISPEEEITLPGEPSIPTELKIDITSVELKENQTKTVTVSGDGPFTWKSSNESVATVDSNGKITAKSSGTATITVTDANGNSKTISVKVSKDNTIIDGDHAKTGESTALLVAVALVAVVTIVFGVKSKKINKLFVMLPLLFTISFVTKTSDAVTVTIDNKVKVGILASAEGIDTDYAIGIIPKADLRSDNSLLLTDLQEFLTQNSITNPSLTTHDGTAKTQNDPIVTGDILTGENSKTYTIIMYGDANADGLHCDSADMTVIRDDFVYAKKAEGESKIAANLYVDTILDVSDIELMKQKFLNKQDLVISEENFDDTESEKLFALSKDEGATWQEYASLSEAVAAAGTTSATIKPLADTNIYGDNVEIKEGQDITIDLDGKNLSGVYYNISLSGNLSIEDSKGTGSFRRTTPGFIEMKKESAVLIVNSGAISCTSNTIYGGIGEVVVNGGTITSTATPINADLIRINGGNITSANTAAVYGNTVMLENGTVTGKFSAISADNVTIKGGTVSSSDAAATVVTTESLTVTGGTIIKESPTENGNAYAIKATGGQINISGGTITGAGQPTGCENYAIFASEADITVTGGTITAGVASVGTIYQEGDSKNITIAGGRISTGEYNGTAIYQNSENGNITVTNGTIKGWDKAIYQNNGQNIYVYKNADTEKIEITLTSSSNVGDGTEIYAAIYKENEGNIIIGTEEDTEIYGEDVLNIDGPIWGIYATKATVNFLNGYIDGGIKVKDCTFNDKFTLCATNPLETDPTDNTKTTQTTLYYINE